jgi:glycosyltransferase involved in cell wall biosynthesis
MKNRKKITVTLVIVARNEKKSSEVIFPRIPKKSVDDIILMDGNSTDGTQRYYKKQGVKVIEQKQKGIGAAMLEGREHVKTDALIFFHPDGNENPVDIAKVADALREGHQFVIPSRMIKGGFNEEDNSLLKPRKWFNQIMALFINLLWRRRLPFVSEIVQGFRGIQCETFDMLKIDKIDCSIDFQMVIRALKYKVPIYEFPTKEGNRLFGETNFTALMIGPIELKMFFREVFDKTTYPPKSVKPVLSTD